MTAEIAVINKLAVTLAADSAVTIENSGGTKVYNSADKIFEATTFDPIGVMVYNNPELCGVPVEAIVKMYRDRHCRRHYETVFEFADAFLAHIEKFDTPEETAKASLWTLIGARIFGLKELLRSLTDEFVREATKEKFPSIDELVQALDAEALEVLDDQIAELEAIPLPEWAEGITITDVLSHHGDAIAQYVDGVFEGEHPTAERRARVISILALSLLKENQRASLTGLVFAGFGEKEIFPSLFSVEIYGMVAGRLKHTRQLRFDVDRKLVPDAAAFPFAQKEMVDRFMYGLDQEFLALCATYFSGALDKFKGHLAANIGAIDEETAATLDPAVDAILDEFRESIVADHLSRLQNQFSDMIRSMPKQELATLAESLVHITSLKRKFSAGAESVGGPIDVAMITRAEGFVWVKRKHYFDAELNPRYFHRRFGGNNSDNPSAGAEQEVGEH